MGGGGDNRRSAKGKREVTLPSPQPFSTSAIRRRGLAGASCKNRKTGYTTSVARNSYLTNKPEATMSSFHQCSGKESRKKDLRSLRSHLGIKHGTSRTEGCALTNCANPTSLQSVPFRTFLVQSISI